jgi:hypothetical protein
MCVLLLRKGTAEAWGVGDVPCFVVTECKQRLCCCAVIVSMASLCHLLSLRWCHDQRLLEADLPPEGSIEQNSVLHTVAITIDPSWVGTNAAGLVLHWYPAAVKQPMVCWCLLR